MAQMTNAQQLLTLDSCRALALKNNKQLSVARVQQEVADNLRRSARTKYLPHVSALGAYEWTSREVSILNDDQKAALSGLGTTMAGSLQSSLGPYAQILPPALQQRLGSDLQSAAGLLNQGGQRVVDAFRTDSRNVFAGAVMLTQPIFMGGAIVAMNKMADIGEQMAQHTAESQQQSTLYGIDQAYWQVVSLRHKQRLAESYLQLVKKLDGDVQKMIAEGVATRSEGLSVSVKVNEAEMSCQQVNDGLVLSRMLLCQLCGLPVDRQVTLADEQPDTLSESRQPLLHQPDAPVEEALAHRPELKLLQGSVDMSRQLTNVLRAGNLPQVLLTGGYAISNPNVFNGFERKFGGFWNVGVMVRVPVWNWGDVAYKVRASKGATAMARLQLEEAREKIELQVNQSAFRVKEAQRKLQLAEASTARADENLRTANLGFAEGVISSTTVMEAQTAWLQAQSQKIDAQIGLRLSEVNMRKAMGTLKYD
jgi:outer membrane protein TolC